VWPDDTFVDFDRGLNFCIAQIRSALGDDAAQPRFVRTLHKRGYAFVCPIDTSSSSAALAGSHATIAPESPRPPSRRRWPLAAWAIPLVFGILVTAGIALAYRASPPIVAVVRFDNETGDPSFTRIADSLTDTVVERLTAAGTGRYLVIGNAAPLRRDRQDRDLSTIATSLHANYVVLGQLQRDSEHLRVLAHLIRLPDQTHVRVSRTDNLPVTFGTLADVDSIAERITRAFDETLLTISSHTFHPNPPRSQ
jgi:TolB-like protein